MGRLNNYYQLTKPGIIYGNTMTAAAGFLFASGGHVNFEKFATTTLGIALIIACGCVLNNYIDREIDVKMRRTKKRALVSGVISTRRALIFAALLLALGTTLLAVFVNLLVVLLGIVALIFYVGVYSYAKRQSVHGTLVGSIAGSMSLLAGYCAARGSIDKTAIILFIILAAWQMPHFYAIAIFREKDYKNADIPVLPIMSGIYATKIQIVLYILVFIIASLSLSILSYASLVYATVMLAIGVRWLQLAVSGFSSADSVIWARKSFGFSLVVLLVFSAMISIDSWIEKLL